MPGLTQRERLRTREPRERNPAHEHQREHEIDQPRTEHRSERNRQQQSGKREHHIHQSHEHEIHPTADPAGGKPHRGSDQERTPGNTHRDQQRGPRAGNQTGRNRAAEIITA